MKIVFVGVPGHDPGMDNYLARKRRFQVTECNSQEYWTAGRTRTSERCLFHPVAANCRNFCGLSPCDKKGYNVSKAEASLLILDGERGVEPRCGPGLLRPEALILVRESCAALHIRTFPR